MHNRETELHNRQKRKSSFQWTEEELRDFNNFTNLRKCFSRQLWKSGDLAGSPRVCPCDDQKQGHSRLTLDGASIVYYQLCALEQDIHYSWTWLYTYFFGCLQHFSFLGIFAFSFYNFSDILFNPVCPKCYDFTV